MSTVAELSSLIEIDEHYMDGTGWPMIRGTGVPVARIALSSTLEGMTPAEIAEDWTLSLAQVYAALAYYHLNRDAIEQQLDVASEEGERMAREWPSKMLSPKIP